LDRYVIESGYRGDRDHMQTPPTQTPLSQTFPQEPQLLGSVPVADRSTHAVGLTVGHPDKGGVQVSVQGRMPGQL
jgi:hypothetical protein